MSFFKSLFSSTPESPEEEKEKEKKNKFEMFKYDGLRAQRMGNLDYAVKCFEGALNFEKDFETMGYLAQTLSMQGKLAEAHDLLKSMTELEPNYINTFLSICNVCFLQENYEEMQQYAERATAIDPKNATAYLLLGKATHALKDDITAVGHLTKALVNQEDLVEAQLLRAEVLLEMNQLKEAEEDVNSLLEAMPDDEASITLKGKLQEAQGLDAEAETTYRHLLEINPFSEQAYLQTGKLLERMKRYDEAIALYDEAIELIPTFGDAFEERGKVKLLNGDKDGSVEDLKKALELKPKEGENINGEFQTPNFEQKTDILGL